MAYRQAILDFGYFDMADSTRNFCDIRSSTPFDYRVHRYGVRTFQSLVRFVKLKEVFLETAQKSCVAMVLNGTYHSSRRYYSDKVDKKLYKA